MFVVISLSVVLVR